MVHCHILLILQVCKGPQQHEEVCLGLFALLLTEPPQAQRVRHCYNVILISIIILHIIIIHIIISYDHWGCQFSLRSVTLLLHFQNTLE